MNSHVFDLIAQEEARQRENVELIASENFVSENVLRAVGSVLTNKYAEGYPAEHAGGNRGRYYGGCGVVDELEEYCCQKWQEAFSTDYHVNVQPHSGSSANLAAYMSVLKPGDTVLAMDLSNGGHLTHGSSVNFSGRLFNFVFYNVDENGFIDYADLEAKAESLSRKRSARTLWWIWPTSRALSPAAFIPAPSASPTSSPPPRTRRCAVRAAVSSSADRSLPKRWIPPSSPAARAAR